jgi:hypothetical protein
MAQKQLTKRLEFHTHFLKTLFCPYLKTKYQKESARHIKWIGQLEQFFYSDNDTADVFLQELNIAGHFEARFFLKNLLPLISTKRHFPYY